MRTLCVIVTSGPRRASTMLSGIAIRTNTEGLHVEVHICPIYTLTLHPDRFQRTFERRYMYTVPSLSAEARYSLFREKAICDIQDLCSENVATHEPSDCSPSTATLVSLRR